MRRRRRGGHGHAGAERRPADWGCRRRRWQWRMSAKRGRWWPPWSWEMVGEGFRRRGGPPWEWWGKEAKERKAKGYIKAAAMEGRRARRQARRRQRWWLTPACRLWVGAAYTWRQAGIIPFAYSWMVPLHGMHEAQRIIQQMHVESADGC